MTPSTARQSSQRPVRSVAARAAASANSSPAVRVVALSAADSVAMASAERASRPSSLAMTAARTATGSRCREWSAAWPRAGSLGPVMVVT